jgi:N-formylglutamate amidohydrolase
VRTIRKLIFPVPALFLSQTTVVASWFNELIFANDSLNRFLFNEGFFLQDSFKFMYPKLVLAIPHSIRAFNTTLWNNPVLAEKDADMWTDWYTDDIFTPAESPRITAVKGQISRFDCDLERLINDPLEEVGRGILYTLSHSGATRTLSREQSLNLMQHWYDYRQQLQMACVPNGLLIDCHSFPSSTGDVDLCVGFNDDASRPSEEVIQSIQQHFQQEGYSVGINTPYSNSLSPDFGYSYHSVMIELNKRIYLCEQSYQLLPQSTAIHQSLERLYHKLLI